MRNYFSLSLILSNLAFVGCKVKCNNMLTSNNCHKKYYYAYVPQLEGRWAWYYCKAKRNFGKLPDYAFVQYQSNADGTLSAVKGGIDPAGIGPYDQRTHYEGGYAYENDGCNLHACRVALIKVGTLKAIKDNPQTAKNQYSYYTPYQMFEAQKEPDYAHIKTESILHGCPITMNCLPENGLTMKRMNELCNLISFRKDPSGKPPLRNDAGSGNITGDGCVNPNNIFESNKVYTAVNRVIPPLGQNKFNVYPSFNQSPFLERNTGVTYRDIYLDLTKDMTGKRDARRYVYTYATVPHFDWDTSESKKTHFTIKLKTPRAPQYDIEINLKTCRNFPNYNEEEKNVCANVLNAFTSSNGDVFYTVRFPIENVGLHNLELIRIQNKESQVYDNYQFNVFQSNTIVYNEGKAEEKKYTGHARNIDLTLLNFPSPSIPRLNDCKLDAFSTLEETLEDTYSLNENNSPSEKKETTITGVDFRIKDCEFSGEVAKGLHHLIDDKQILKVNLAKMKQIVNESEPKSFSTSLFKLLSENSTTLVAGFSQQCPQNVNDFFNNSQNDDPMKTLAFIAKEIKYADSDGNVLETDASGQLIEKTYKDFTVSSEDRQNLKTPNELMGGSFLGYTLPNIGANDLNAGRVAILLHDNIEKVIKETNLTKLNFNNYASIVLAHELSHIWANQYMMHSGKHDPEEAHQAYCTGKDECKCIFRYDNQTNDWAEKINKSGATFCESHRQIILNQLIRKF